MVKQVQEHLGEGISPRYSVSQGNDDSSVSLYTTWSSLKHVNPVKYLDVHISQDVQWNKCIDYITTNANSTLDSMQSSTILLVDTTGQPVRLL